MAHDELRALVVDDAVSYRRILSDLVEATEGVCLVGTAARGSLALSKMESTPTDIVLLDFEMPEMDGLQTLEKIRTLYPEVSVVLVCGATSQSTQNRAKAFKLGALDYIEKPMGDSPEASRAQLRQLLEGPWRAARIKKSLSAGQRHNGAAAPSTAPASPAAETAAPRLRPALAAQRGRPSPELLVIGVSTGGPEALIHLIPSLPAEMRIPILLVQHMPAVFTASLAEDLNRRSAIEVREAVDGELISAGTVLIAPGGRHMAIRPAPPGSPDRTQYFVKLNDAPPENSCRPSVDVLFRSVAEQFAEPVLAVIMTGMGADGCEGVRRLKRGGCYCITQSEESCVVYGMPLAVDEAGLSDESVPLNLLAERITHLVQEEALR